MRRLWFITFALMLLALSAEVAPPAGAGHALAAMVAAAAFLGAVTVPRVRRAVGSGRFWWALPATLLTVAAVCWSPNVRRLSILQHGSMDTALLFFMTLVWVLLGHRAEEREATARDWRSFALRAWAPTAGALAMLAIHAVVRPAGDVRGVPFLSAIPLLAVALLIRERSGGEGRNRWTAFGLVAFGSLLMMSPHVFPQYPTLARPQAGSYYYGDAAGFFRFFAPAQHRMLSLGAALAAIPALIDLFTSPSAMGYAFGGAAYGLPHPMGAPESGSADQLILRNIWVVVVGGWYAASALPLWFGYWVSTRASGRRQFLLWMPAVAAVAYTGARVAGFRVLPTSEVLLDDLGSQVPAITFALLACAIVAAVRPPPCMPARCRWFVRWTSGAVVLSGVLAVLTCHFYSVDMHRCASGRPARESAAKPLPLDPLRKAIALYAQEYVGMTRHPPASAGDAPAPPTAVLLEINAEEAAKLLRVVDSLEDAYPKDLEGRRFAPEEVGRLPFVSQAIGALGAVLRVELESGADVRVVSRYAPFLRLLPALDSVGSADTFFGAFGGAWNVNRRGWTVEDRVRRLRFLDAMLNTIRPYAGPRRDVVRPDPIPLGWPGAAVAAGFDWWGIRDRSPWAPYFDAIPRLLLVRTRTLLFRAETGAFPNDWSEVVRRYGPCIVDEFGDEWDGTYGYYLSFEQPNPAPTRPGVEGRTILWGERTDRSASATRGARVGTVFWGTTDRGTVIQEAEHNPWSQIDN